MELFVRNGDPTHGGAQRLEEAFVRGLGRWEFVASGHADTQPGHAYNLAYFLGRSRDGQRWGLAVVRVRDAWDPPARPRVKPESIAVALRTAPGTPEAQVAARLVRALRASDELAIDEYVAFGLLDESALG